MEELDEEQGGGPAGAQADAGPPVREAPEAAGADAPPGSEEPAKAAAPDTAPDDDAPTDDGGDEVPAEREFMVWRTMVYDSASPFSGRYLDDRSDDPLATEARIALEEALSPTDLVYPDDEPVGGCYFRESEAGSPSLVLHSMGAGVLLELGFAPSAPCVKRHLQVIKHRLYDPRVLSGQMNPDEAASTRDDRLLRTRHVAWVLAQLAELPSTGLPDNATHEQAEPTWLHHELAETAFAYLDGDDDGPGSWIGLRKNEGCWSEYWRGTRESNLLNTIYASLAIARASRHGLITHNVRWSRRRPSPVQVIGDLADRIRLVSTDKGPRTRLDMFDRREGGFVRKGGGSPFSEPWAKGDLPAGVVGLLCIFLIEYAYTIAESETEGTGLHYLLRAQRLAHDLMSRPDEWVRSIELYSWDPVKEEESPNWPIFAYSVCLRAVLEAGVVDTTHPSLLAAFQTIQATQERAVTADGREYTTWVDVGEPYKSKPHRGEGWMERVSVHEELGLWESDRASEHSSEDTRGLTKAAKRRANKEAKTPKDRDPGLKPSPHAIHSSVMAWAAVRRALWREDPRTTVIRGKTDGTASLKDLRVPRRLAGRDEQGNGLRPLPNFDRLELTGVLPGEVLLKARSTAVRSEMDPIRCDQALVLLALNLLPERRASVPEVRKALTLWRERRAGARGAGQDPVLSHPGVSPLFKETPGRGKEDRLVEVARELSRSRGCALVVTAKGTLILHEAITEVDVSGVDWGVELDDLRAALGVESGLTEDGQ